MASGGGGSWKVAYADFVTALMAFFLVMWICAQDQNTREAVAHYFNEPYQFFRDPVGANRKPDARGAMFQKKSAGTVPESEAVGPMGRGRESFTPPDSTSPATRTVSTYLQNNTQAARHWHEKAVAALKTASLSEKAYGNSAKIEEEASHILAGQLEDELKKDRPKKGDSLQDDLLTQAFSDVNWTELAEDLLRHERL
ncbi:MAG TPA: flagellar motor protein MotB, partial [Gemmataceae bacterium]|nr:flagellar motor protein MotB [Gemmataceae bacterium]